MAPRHATDVAAQVDAVAGLRRLIEASSIDCAMTPAPAITFAFALGALEAVQAEYDAAVDAGLPVQWNAATDLPFETAGCVTLGNQFHINPAALCAALGARLGPERVFEHTTVVGVDDGDGSDCVVTTEPGHELRAQHVIDRDPVTDHRPDAARQPLHTEAVLRASR